jgi:hypothetical protein
MRLVLALLLAGLLTACSSGSGSTDAGFDGDLEDAGDAGAPDGTANDADAGTDQAPADLDLGRDFALLIPAGTQLCTMFLTPDVVAEHDYKARITPRPGYVRLPRDLTEFEDDWIEKLELAPDGQVATPQSAGRFYREIQGDEQDGIFSYRYQQSFATADRTYQLSVIAAFEVQSGEALRPVTELDEYVLSKGGDWYLYIGIQGEFPDQQFPREYMTCRYDLFEPGLMRLEVENGDLVELDLRLLECPPDNVCSGQAVMGEVVAASFVRDTTRREVDDFFHLGFTHKHHGNFDYSYLVLFDQPVDSIHGLWIPEPETSIAPIEVKYLDGEMNVLDVKLVSERTFNP